MHLQDVYGKFADSGYFGVKNENNGKYATIRTMNSQLHSTRIFNENYFAFLAALDDVVKKNVKYVIFPGDFSDDGQPINIRGLRKILNQYSKTHGLKFFLITGNHDPVKPYTQDAGKNDFLGTEGKAQPIMSKAGMYVSNPDIEHPAIITNDIKKLGYQEITTMLSDYGFFPKKDYLYWETPFSTYNTLTYNFNDALKMATLKDRQYSVPESGFSVPDVSYLVEPIEGLWLLAIDANVYVPKKEVNANSKDPNNYLGASIGYNNVLSHKRHLIDWISKVAKEAGKQGKKLIAFSHYPMIEFNDGASLDIENLMGKGKMQLHRVPKEDVAQIFADAGIKCHFGGHMHINDTGIRKTKQGNTLVNVQIPSLAAYIPAYKLLTIKEKNILEVETIIVDSVPRFNEFFNLYKEEHLYLEYIKTKDIWNKDILTSKDYLEFTNWHLRELTRLRFLPNDWPEAMRHMLLNCTGKELLILSQMDTKLSLYEAYNRYVERDLKQHKDWDKATQVAQETFKNNTLLLADFNKWTGFDLIFDFYRLRNADKLAIRDIGERRLKEYTILLEAFLNKKQFFNENDTIKNNFQDLARIFQKFMNGEPADHFKLNLDTGIIQAL